MKGPTEPEVTQAPRSKSIQ